MRVLQIAGPYLPVPPGGYGGSERVIDSLACELTELGVELTTFTVGTSRTAGKMEFHFAEHQAPSDETGDFTSWDPAAPSIQAGKAFARAAEYDFVHNHLSQGIAFSEVCPTPMLTTLHSFAATGSKSDRIFANFPDARYVAISDSQRRLAPHLNVVATVPNPIPHETWRSAPEVTRRGEYLLFLGRLSHLKGAELAVGLAARWGLPLIIAGPVFPADRPYFHEVLEPLLDTRGVTYVGGVAGERKADLLRGALATVVPSQWDEPFGLTALESMALGTPALVSPRGALPEMVEHDVTGLVVPDFGHPDVTAEDVLALDRAVVADQARQRFAPAAVAASYLALYRRFA
ncbi:glycosyltransferase [Micromonospora sp. NPDC049645]|uniref:glycosyltransferase n=1 Tax=Micromonospora sp. NPDC049645 TaxID=3155508 RepID=UPI003433DF44